MEAPAVSRRRPRRVLDQALDNHPAVLAWELGNEFAIQPQPSSDDDYNSFIAFASAGQ